MTPLATSSVRRRPIRSASAPVSGAENADAYVRKPRNNPEAKVDPPRSRMRNGAVGNSWNADRNTVKVNPHMTKKRGVKSRRDTGLAIRASGFDSIGIITQSRSANSQPRNPNPESRTSNPVYNIGVIADTHGLVRPEIAIVFRGVDLILHAGDVGCALVIAAL